MKRFLFASLLLILSFTSRSQITWDGGGDAVSWSDATNWVGDVAPTSTDNVLLDNSVVPGSYTVNLPAGAIAVTVNTLTITPTGVNNITLLLPSSNTAIPALDILAAGDALVLNSGAILKNSSGAVSGVAISIADVFRINNGGHYIHNTGTGNFSIVNRLSTVAGTELGEFEYDVPNSGYGISVAGRTYGTLTIKAVENGGPTTYTGSGVSACNVNGNLNINADVTFILDMSGNFIVDGDYNQAATSTFNLQSSTNSNVVQIAGDLTINGNITESNTGLPTLQLNGTANQNITATTGTISNSVTVNMNNSSGATLNSALTLPYNLTLTAGTIDIGANNLTVAGTITGGGTSSYIKTSGAGVLTLQAILTNKTFPIGNTTYNPLVITTASGNDFSARVENGINPPLALPINSIYAVQRTWNIFASANTASVQVTYQYGSGDFGSGVNATDVMEILQHTGAVWSILQQNRPQSGSDPYQVSSTVAGLSIATTSTPYLIGKSGGFVLPIDCIISTRGQKRNNTGLISWTVNSCSDVRSFEVQRSTGNGNYQTIGTVAPVANQTDFNFTDPSLARGTNLYRIKVNRVAGGIKYSNTVALIYDSNELLITSFAPNPVHDMATLTLSTARQGGATFKVYDVSGNLVKQWHSNIAEGNNTIEMNVTGLPAGIYHVLVSTTDARTVTRFVKQ